MGTEARRRIDSPGFLNHAAIIRRLRPGILTATGNFEKQTGDFRENPEYSKVPERKAGPLRQPALSVECGRLIFLSRVVAVRDIGRT